MTAKIDMKVFFDLVRKSVFKGTMSASQVAGLERLLNAWDEYGDSLSPVADERCSYGLATSWWETGHRMQPVRETYATSTAQAISRLNNAFKKGQMRWVKSDYWSLGWFGRGDVQLTHEANYKGALRDAVKAVFGVDIHAEPDLVLRPDISAFILFEGISKGVTLKADFTAFALEDFIKPGKIDFHNARKTVNPGDRDSYEPIAKVAQCFCTAIKAARKQAGAPQPALGTAPKREEPDYQSGKPNDTVLAVQERLRTLRYPEVGTPDGRWGSKTAAAILAFQNDNGLPTKAKIDDALLAALAKAQPRVIGKTRSQATVETVKDEPVVKDSLTLDKIGKWAMGIGAFFGVSNGALDVAALPSTIKSVQEVIVLLLPLIPYAALVIGGFFVYRFARKVIQEHLKGYQAGRNL